MLGAAHHAQVCAGTTGHAEVAQVTFRPAEITLDEILEIFFAMHDPTQLDRQGNDVGTQYRSVIFFLGDPQHAAALRARDAVQARFGGAGNPVVTAIEPACDFHIAETYHQAMRQLAPPTPPSRPRHTRGGDGHSGPDLSHARDADALPAVPPMLFTQNYFNENRTVGYCRYIIKPALKRLKHPRFVSSRTHKAKAATSDQEAGFQPIGPEGEAREQQEGAGAANVA